MWDAIKPHLVGHTDREAQDRIFEGVIERLRTEQLVSLEGGPGTGKSLFASVMALAASSRGSQLFYVPRTKAQQDMIETETIPRMRHFLPMGYAVLKGRSMYVCLRRAEMAGFKLEIIGDGTSAHYPMNSDDWALVCSSKDAGCGSRCGSEDAYQIARDKASMATMVITNQSVLAADYAVGGRILNATDDDYLLVDEAHLLPGVMQGQLGGFMSVARLEHAWRDASAWVDADGLADAAKVLNRALSFAGVQWTEYGAGKLIRDGVEEVWADIKSMIERIEEPPPELLAMRWRLQGLLGDADYLAGPIETHSVVVVAQKRGRLVVEAKKFDVRRESLDMFSNFRRTVLMSATMEPLATKLLGAPEPVTGPAPFDTATNRLAYHPTWTPSEPNQAHQWSADELRTLVRHARGGALVVASSNEQKTLAAEVLLADGWSVGVQTGGGESVRALVQGLKDRVYDVIVGVDSVGTGIDVPGDALRLVVILSAFNPNPFSDIHLKLWGETFPNKTTAWRELFTPMAVEKTEQAIGRLLRTPSDRGVVAFLDPRLRPRNQFRGLAAPSRFTGNLDDVKEFFDAR